NPVAKRLKCRERPQGFQVDAKREARGAEQPQIVEGHAGGELQARAAAGRLQRDRGRMRPVREVDRRVAWRVRHVVGEAEPEWQRSRDSGVRAAGQRGGSGGEPGRREELRSEEHTSELQSRRDLVCRLLLEKKKEMVSTELYA